MEQILAAPQIQEQSGEVFNVIRQERVSEHIVERIVAVPQIQQLAVEVFTVTLATRPQSEEMNHRDLEVPAVFLTDLKRMVESCRSTDEMISGKVERGVRLSECAF